MTRVSQSAAVSCVRYVAAKYISMRYEGIQRERNRFSLIYILLNMYELLISTFLVFTIRSISIYPDFWIHKYFVIQHYFILHKLQIKFISPFLMNNGKGRMQRRFTRWALELLKYNAITLLMHDISFLTNLQMTAYNNNNTNDNGVQRIQIPSKRLLPCGK